jgi:hypothetical protein
MLSKKEKRAIKFTIEAIADTTSQWYADGYITKKQIDRLISWEFKLRRWIEKVE